MGFYPKYHELWWLNHLVLLCSFTSLWMVLVSWTMLGSVGSVRRSWSLRLARRAASGGKQGIMYFIRPFGMKRWTALVTIDRNFCSPEIASVGNGSWLNLLSTKAAKLTQSALLLFMKVRSSDSTNFWVSSTLITIGKWSELNAETASHDSLWSNEVLASVMSGELEQLFVLW